MLYYQLGEVTFPVRSLKKVRYMKERGLQVGYHESNIDQNLKKGLKFLMFDTQNNLSQVSRRQSDFEFLNQNRPFLET